MQSQATTQWGWGVEGWRTHLYPAMSTPPPPPPPGPRNPGKGCAQRTVCSSEIRLLRQRSGLAGYRALPAPLSPLAGAGAGQGTQGGPAEGPREKERVGRHSTGHLLQDSPVLSLPANVADGKPTVRHVPRCQDTEANTFRRRVNQASRGMWRRFTRVHVKLFWLNKICREIYWASMNRREVQIRNLYGASTATSCLLIPKDRIKFKISTFRDVLIQVSKAF